MFEQNKEIYDYDYELALQLSRQSFSEENKKRLDNINLLDLEDPVEKEKNFKIEQIKKLLNLNKNENVDGEFSQLKSEPNPLENYLKRNNLEIINDDGFKDMPSTSEQSTSKAMTNSEEDLINLTCSNQITVEDFDPLFQKLKQVKPELFPEIPESVKEEQRIRDVLLKKRNKFDVDYKEDDEKIKYHMFTFENINIDSRLKCDFYKEKKALIDESYKFAYNSVKETEQVFFWASISDYFITNAESIKLVVYKDDSWDNDTSVSEEKVEFACDVHSNCEIILVEVLTKLLSQDEIGKNDGEIPSKDYALKIYGTDQFLVPNVEIGRHTFIKRYLSLGKDIEIEIGKLNISKIYIIRKSNLRFKKAPLIVNKELYFTFKSTIETQICRCLENPQDMILRYGVVQSLKMLTTFMNNLTPIDLIEAINKFAFEVNNDELIARVHNIALAVERLLRMYSKSALTDFSVLSDDEDYNEVSKKKVHELRNYNEKVLVCIESLHNMLPHWDKKYKAFYVEANLMFGLKSYGKITTRYSHANFTKHGFSLVNFSFWAEYAMILIAMPREAQFCFVLRGIPYSTDNTEVLIHTNDNKLLPVITPNEIQFADFIGYGCLPLFNCEDQLLQGPYVVPLTLMQDDTVEPWGPRPYIRNTYQPMLVIKLLEYGSILTFPVRNHKAFNLWKNFNELPADEQESLLFLIDNTIKNQVLPEDVREKIWTNRSYLYQIPKALPVVLTASSSWSFFNAANIKAILDEWAPLPPSLALELLFPNFQNKFVREKAIEYLRNGSSDFFFNLTSQFVEALRFEQHEKSPLSLFLLELSSKNLSFAFELYWQLHYRSLEPNNSPYAVRCSLLKTVLVELNIPLFRTITTNQLIFFNELDDVLNNVKKAPEANMRNVLRQELHRLNDEYDMRNIRLPIAPHFQCRLIEVSECDYFNSLNKPIKIIFSGRNSKYGIIYKVGDDLRQDAIVLQLIYVMNDIWLSNQIDLRMIIFRCLPTGIKKGMIELVSNSNTLREIQTTDGATGVFKDDVLNNWLLKHNPSEFQYKNALENFRRSCAGWCVATYVLGIGDRHNDNILVTINGHVFHIDFGKYMGDWQTAVGFKRDRVPFVLTADMAYVINGGVLNSTESFQSFIDDCCKAFNLLRQNYNMLTNIISFMTCSGVSGMNVDSINFIESNLLIGLKDDQATAIFTRMISESLNSKFPRLNFFAHTLAHLKSSTLFSCRSDDMNRISFISEVYSLKTSSRITLINAFAYEKWFVPEKIYMYKISISHQNENVPTIIYRSFAEFEELQWKLNYRFSNKAIPSLEFSNGMLKRTNVRSVAAKRLIDLQTFLQNLFNLSDEVAHCDLIYTFFHTIYRDSEPEVIKRQKSIYNESPIEYPKIHLRLMINFQTSVLSVFVGHAKHLPFIGSQKTLPDSYVKTYILTPNRLLNKHFKRKTCVVKNTQNPTYNYQITYEFVDKNKLKEMFNYMLKVSIWNVGSTGIKDNFQISETIISLCCFNNIDSEKVNTHTIENWYFMKLVQSH